jgi:hypothetical protein
MTRADWVVIGSAIEDVTQKEEMIVVQLEKTSGRYELVLLILGLEGE